MFDVLTILFAYCSVVNRIEWRHLKMFPFVPSLFLSLVFYFEDCLSADLDCDINGCV